MFRDSFLGHFTNEGGLMEQLSEVFKVLSPHSPKQLAMIEGVIGGLMLACIALWFFSRSYRRKKLNQRAAARLAQGDFAILHANANPAEHVLLVLKLGQGRQIALEFTPDHRDFTRFFDEGTLADVSVGDSLSFGLLSESAQNSGTAADFLTVNTVTKPAKKEQPKLKQLKKAPDQQKALPASTEH